MDASGIQARNAQSGRSGRSVATACNAPFVSLEFDTQGFAYSCCANGIYPVGNVAHDSLQEIWTGARLAAQREALKADDLSYGCNVCRWHLDNGEPNPPATMYERWSPSTEAPDRPVSLAFAFSNQCNLQCVQCSGEYSSSIRIHREGRPPLPHAYGDRFFDELPSFLPHAESIRLLGGEPFLVSETYRLLDLLTSLDLRPGIHVTTNATRLDRRVEAAFDEHALSVSLSLDAATPSVLEAIRVGCKAEEVLSNAQRFSELTRTSGGSLGINFCLMRHNWRELPKILRLGDDLGAWVSVITVHNDDHSLYKLPADDLRAAVDELVRGEEDLTRSLALNRPVWNSELDRLRSTLETVLSGASLPMLEPGHHDNTAVMVERRRTTRIAVVEDVPPNGPWWRRRRGRAAVQGPSVAPVNASEVTDELIRWAVGGAVVVVDTDALDRVTAVEIAYGDPPGVDPSSWQGWSFESVSEQLRTTWGRSVWLVEHLEPQPGRVDQLIAFSETPHREKRGVALRMVSIDRSPGWRTHLAIDPSFLPADHTVLTETDVALR